MYWIYLQLIKWKKFVLQNTCRTNKKLIQSLVRNTEGREHFGELHINGGYWKNGS